jgi:tetratricopeptide (TPR) repeat protein
MYLRGDVLHELRRYRDAVACYSDILVLEESDIAFGNKGLAHWELGEFDRALWNYQEAIKLNPGNTTSLRGAGEMQLKLGFPLRAVPYLVLAVKLRPRYADALSALGTAYVRTGQDGLAKKIFSNALKLDPEDVRAKKGLRRILSLGAKSQK